MAGLNRRRFEGNSVQKVHNSILETVGNTPLVKLAKIPKEYGLSCEIYAKCEYMNPSGSIKDRITVSMTNDAEKHGRLHKHTMLVEASSGNTGIGVALDAALKELPCTIVTREKNSLQKVNTIRLLGAEVIQIKNNEDEEAVAQKIVNADPANRLTLEQFKNPVNPLTHYNTTCVELIEALGDFDMAVMGAGSGGTITGIGERLKKERPTCLVVACEPDGSTVINKHGKFHQFLVEGIGGKTAPQILDESVVDHFEVITDEESFLMARKLAVREGLLCGGSSGTAMAAAIKAAKHFKLGKEHRVVVILPDGIRNYMSKFVCDQWMEAHLFMDPPQHTMKWWNEPITQLDLKLKYPLIDDKATCEQALNQMKELEYGVVTDCKGWFIGMVSKDSLRYYATNPTKLPMLSSENMNFQTLVIDHLVKDCFSLPTNGKKGMPTIGRLSRILDITPFVIVGSCCHQGDHFKPISVVTGSEVLDYIFRGSQKGIF